MADSRRRAERFFWPCCRIVFAYAAAYHRGLEQLLDDLRREIDEARDAAARCLRAGERPTRRATLAGYEHAQIERMQGKAEEPMKSAA